MSMLLKKSDELLPQVERVLARLFSRISALLPEAELHHIGATALPGALTKGDIDVLLRVPLRRFSTAVDVLRQHFQIKQAVNWTPEFASFGDDTGYELRVGIQVVIKDSSMDFLLFLHDHFLHNPQALDEYNRLKTAHSDADHEHYWKAKDEFLSRILAARKT